MYDWERREQTKDLLAFEPRGWGNNNNQPKTPTTTSQHTQEYRKQIRNQNSQSFAIFQTPKSHQQAQYPGHHLNVSTDFLARDFKNIENLNQNSNSSCKTQPFQRYANSKQGADHSPICARDSQTKADEDKNDIHKRRLRITSTFTSSLFTAEKEQRNNDIIIPSTSKSQIIEQNGQNGHTNELMSLRQDEIVDISKRQSRNANNRSTWNDTLGQKEQAAASKFLQSKRHIPVAESKSFTFHQDADIKGKKNQNRLKDHAIFGEENTNTGSQGIVAKQKQEGQDLKKINKDFEPLYMNDITAAERRYEQLYQNEDKQTSNNKKWVNNQWIDVNAKDGSNKIENINAGNTHRLVQPSNAHISSQIQRQIDNIGNLSANGVVCDENQLKLNQRNADNMKSELRSYDQKWWHKKVETAKGNTERFLTDCRSAEEIKFKQLKSDFFEEVSHQIFGKKEGQEEQQEEKIDTSAAVAGASKGNKKMIQSNWQYDNSNSKKKRTNQLFSDLFSASFDLGHAPDSLNKDGTNRGSSNQLNQTDKLTRIFPADFDAGKYDSIKFQTDFPSFNISYDKCKDNEQNQLKSVSEEQENLKKIGGTVAPCDERFYANLSSCLDPEGYQVHYHKNEMWKKETHQKFERYALADKTTDDEPLSHPVNFGGAKRNEGGSQQLLSIPLENYKDGFDERSLKRYCAAAGIHLVDFTVDFNKLTNKLLGTACLKVRDFSQEAPEIEALKHHLQKQGLTISENKSGAQGNGKEGEQQMQGKQQDRKKEINEHQTNGKLYVNNNSNNTNSKLKQTGSSTQKAKNSLSNLKLIATSALREQRAVLQQKKNQNNL